MTFDPKVDKVFLIDDVAYDLVCLRDKFGEETFDEAEARGLIIQNPIDKKYQFIILGPGETLKHMVPS